jgi:uncharacterized protein (TIGR02757 family)
MNVHEPGRKVVVPPDRHREGVFEELYATYNRPEFIHPDPLEFLLRYGEISDREIVGMVASSLAYGRVEQILKGISTVLEGMGPSPALFLAGASRGSLTEMFSSFKHRFTTGEELVDFLMAIKAVVDSHGSLQNCFLQQYDAGDPDVIRPLGQFVAEIKGHLRKRETSLLPCPEKKSACKRLHLFLRWMVRSDAVDPGGWDEVSPAKLIVPLDVHMHRISQALGMTKRKQADLRAALEVTESFRRTVPEDPVRYDFVLTRTGIRNDISLEDVKGYSAKPSDKNSTGGGHNG